jgi:thioredoxin reductase/Pyruvate/2-oxoacid:ferredoxin oxidoreductase delta subunit
MAGKRRTRQTTVDLLLFALVCIIVGSIYQYAREFYEIVGDAQLDHPWYDRWRSAGTVGKALGTAAVAMFLLNLAYGLRRRLRSWHKWGHLRHWMSAHVFFGLLGGGLLLLHAMFRMTSPAARWSALAVIALLATGVIGRYIYALVPHTAFGQEDPDGLRGRGSTMLVELRELWPEGKDALERLAARTRLDNAARVSRGLPLLLLGPLRWVISRLWVRQWLARHGSQLPDEKRQQVSTLAVQVINAGFEVALAAAASWLLRRWRLIHLVAALVMVATAFLHVRSAFLHGYPWDLPGPIQAWGGGFAALLLGFGAWEGRWRRLYRRGKAKAKVQRIGPAPEPPPTLHPWVDPSKCMASAACVASCPEGDILALVEGRGQLAEPSHCIGHGACAANCPVGAITLVFGSLKRGVDIPDVAPNYEASTPGIFLAGELTGMGLVRNAVEQATQAVGFIVRDKDRDRAPLPEAMLDLLIVGAGPAGLAASLAAQEKGLNYQTLEQEPDIGGAVRHYPRRKLVMTSPMHMPLHGNARFFNVFKEELVEFFGQLRDTHKPNIAFGVAVEALGPDASGVGFLIQSKSQQSKSQQWRARRVLLCLGRRGTPMRAEVPGEDLPHVCYNLQDPEQMRDRHVCVVGGGDSALEAAIACADAGARSVHVIHRRDTFDRAKARNRELLQQRVDSGRITLHLNTGLRAIAETSVSLKNAEEFAVDDVIVSIGGSLPTALLKAAGIQTRTHFGRPV